MVQVRTAGERLRTAGVKLYIVHAGRQPSVQSASQSEALRDAEPSDDAALAEIVRCGPPEVAAGLCLAPLACDRCGELVVVPPPNKATTKVTENGRSAAGAADYEGGQGAVAAAPEQEPENRIMPPPLDHQRSASTAPYHPTVQHQAALQ
eukprot:1002389-Prorocentrum_minimum.AAC.1